VINAGGSDLDFEFEGTGSSNQVRVLAHLYGVDLGTEYPNTIDAIDQYFTNYTLDTTSTITSSVLQAALVDKDVLLFPEQEFGSITHYTSFATVIQNFISGGGQVVVCGSSGTTADRIYDMGLFTGSYGSNTSSGNIIVSDTTDDFMDGIPLTFTAVNATFYHNFTNIDKIELASFATSDIVSYRNIGSGKAVYVGFDYFDSNPQVDRIISNTIRYANQNGLPPWISLDSTAGTVSPGDSVLVYVTFYSGSLAGGVYTTNLIVTSNDPLIPSDTIQVTLNVSFNPCANFVFDATSPCNGNIQFQDTTLNAPTSWTWYFGDGDSSNVQNPLHVYSAAGNYTVTLIACNASGCDTISYPVVITAVNGPMAASCTPITTNYCCSAGITRVQLNTINNITPNGTEGYRDFTCTNSTTLTIGISYPITITTGPTSNENVKAWIDYNNNGVFDPVTELVLTSLNILNIHTGNVIPPGNAVINTPLRMRVGSDRSINPVPAPCTNVLNGQFEDYTVTILQNTIPPTAAYAINIIDVCTGEVEFTDLSTNFPTSWAWAFGDGQTSTQQNPTHVYATAGTYSVTLIATNAYGSDTLVQFVTVGVINASMTVSGIQMVGQTLQFTGTAPGATSYLWDFGDGFLSSLQSPTHIYASAGTYIACLTASNANCSATVCDTLVILPVGLEHIDGISTLSIMPNPFQDDISVVYQLDRSKTITLKVTDVLGQTVKMFLDQQVQKPGTYQFKFNTEAPGTYFIVFDSDGQTRTYKILKSK